MSGLSSEICDNLRFLIAEVRTRLDDLGQFIESRRTASAQRILDRRGYSENLMLRIQNAAIQAVADAPEQDLAVLRAIQGIAADLDRISELVRDAIHQMTEIEKEGLVTGKAHLPMIEAINEGLALVEPALQNNDARLALKIGEHERRIHENYRGLLKDYTRAMKQKKQTEDLISALLVSHTLERMGDLLLDICEALLSGIVGQPMGIDRYHSLMDSFQRLSSSSSGKGLLVESIAQTRSGSGISGISPARKKGRKKSPSYLAIHKDGLQSKLKQERDGVENWHEVYPGLAPRILSYKRRGESASLLIEHLAGMTFEQILVRESGNMLHQALKKLSGTLMDVWKETRSKKPRPAGFMKQLNKRIADVYAVHPEFESDGCSVCGYDVEPFPQLVKRAARLEQQLMPPFSVYIHGDFNVDNIIYDPVERRINYIDLHRSRYMDYVQDVSVFMVSNYRLQIMDAPVRRRIMAVISRFHDSCAGFARENGDSSFELRLGLGLARSLVTSTRFILDKSLARNMYLRARYLLEQLDRLEARDRAKYRVPVKAVFSG